MHTLAAQLAPASVELAVTVPLAPATVADAVIRAENVAVHDLPVSAVSVTVALVPAQPPDQTTKCEPAPAAPRSA